MILFKRLAGALAAGFAAATLAGAAHAATYLDKGMTDLKPEDKAVVASPQPVQLVFVFKTKGADNKGATKYLKKQVTQLVTDSGAFSQVSETPVANGAVLTVVVDNIPQENAVATGFVTGMTFGLKGSVVTDYYVCTVEYAAGPEGAKLTKTGKHALHTTIGLIEKGKEPEGVKAKNLVEAVTTMTRQIVSNTLNDVARDPAFAGAPTTMQAEAAAPAAPDAPATPAAPAAAEPAAPAPAAEPATTPAT